MATRTEYYPPEMFAQFALIEKDHWWFRARNRLLLWVLGTRIGSFRSFLEMGCGTGFVLEAVRKAYPHAELFGTEYFEEGLVFARERIPSATFTQLDATMLSEVNRYDVIGAFDVIEHIEHDEQVLSNLSHALNRGGSLLITVPQHRWLWSVTDEYACHMRRYTRTELVNKVKCAGLQVEYVTSFVSLLVPLMWLMRLRVHKRDYDPMSEFKIASWLNRILETVMSIEIGLLKLGLRFYMGGSLLILAKKA